MLTTDPRPDLIDDTKLWTLILPRAKAISQEALEVLHGLRCLGATLQRIQSGYMLTPAIGPGQFYRTREDWLTQHEAQHYSIRTVAVRNTVYRSATRCATVAH